jgi:hypothetical protein
MWSWYRQQNTRKKLNSCRRTTTTTMIMRKKTMRKKKKKKKKRATRLKVKMMKTTLFGATPRRTRCSMTPTTSRRLEMKPRSPLAG